MRVPAIIRSPSTMAVSISPASTPGRATMTSSSLSVSRMSTGGSQAGARADEATGRKTSRCSRSARASSANASDHIQSGGKPRSIASRPVVSGRRRQGRNRTSAPSRRPAASAPSVNRLTSVDRLTTRPRHRSTLLASFDGRTARRPRPRAPPVAAEAVRTPARAWGAHPEQSARRRSNLSGTCNRPACPPVALEDGLPAGDAGARTGSRPVQAATRKARSPCPGSGRAGRVSAVGSRR